MGWLSDIFTLGLTPQQRAKSRATASYVAALEDYERRLALLPVNVAEREAVPVLERSRFLRTEMPSGRVDAPPSLHETLRASYVRFGRVESARGESYLDCGAARPLEWRPELIRLGQQYTHTHLVVSPGSERILVVADDEDVTASPESEYLSVWHWVLWLERNEQLLAESGAGAS